MATTSMFLLKKFLKKKHIKYILNSLTTAWYYFNPIQNYHQIQVLD